eukprot:jgi/Bigna1/89091/estExt_fgenesh1_pg.C_430091
MKALAPLLSFITILRTVRGQPPVVKTPLGLIQGVSTDQANVFRGIRFGTAARWEPPQPVKAWDGVYNATMDGAGCPQHCNLPPITCPPVTSEDCLMLNVFAPKSAKSGDKLPVMLFIHGGAFHQGYIGGPLYTGNSFVQENIVYVAIQYRLGALGFLNRGKDASNITGNYGLMDQVLAMEWVRDNIDAFGGDPSEVTIFGQSAGSQSVAAHLLEGAPAKDLFKRGALFSCPWGIPFRTETQAKSLANAFSKHGGCKELLTKNVDKCLMNLTSDEVVGAMVAAETELRIELAHIVELFEAWTPTRDTPNAPENLLDAYQAGRVQDKEIIIGSVHDEGENFVYEAFKTPVSSAEEDLLLEFLDPKHIFKVKNHYAVPGKDTRDALVGVATDGLFKCPTRYLFSNLSASKEKKHFVYHFNHVASFGDKFWGDETECLNATCHGGDLPFDFHPDISSLKAVYTEEEKSMMAVLQGLLMSFAKTGTPAYSPGNAEKCPALTWPAFTGDTMESMYFQTPCPSVKSNKITTAQLVVGLRYIWLLPSQ